MTMSAHPADPEVVFMVAVAENGAIGRANALPWHLRSDLQRFKKMTLNTSVVMGRKTFASIGRPLPGRTNIVVTRDADFHAHGIVTAPSLEAAHAVARGDALRRRAAAIMVIGGADIFEQWIGRADRLEVTEVHASPDADTFFAVDTTQWQEVERVRHHRTAEDSADFSYVRYCRRVRH